MGLLRQVLIFVFVSRVAVAHCAVRRQRCMHRQVALSATESGCATHASIVIGVPALEACVLSLMQHAVVACVA